MFFADADLIPPTVVGTSPMNLMTNVAVDTTIEVDFSEAVYYVDNSTFTVMVGTNVIPGNISPVSPAIYVFTPSTSLPNNVTVDVTLTNVIIDGSGNPLMQYTFRFDTVP